MTYCRFLSPEGPRYAAVESRGGQLYATSILPPPTEDLAAQMLYASVPAVAFEAVALAELQSNGRLLAPVVPSKIVCVGRNYRDHATELGNDVPAEPLLFLKPPSSLLRPGGDVIMPALSRRVDFEGELAIVVGERCSRMTADDDPRRFIRGYTCLNDATARDIQKADPQWTRGKGFDTFCPVGPVVADHVDPLTENVSLITRVNGEVRQRGETRDFLFDIPHLLRYISACMTLEPGDIIATGTPAGVAPLNDGDLVSVEIAGIGVLENTFRRVVSSE